MQLPTWRAHLAAALSVLGWGSLYVAAKPAVAAAGPAHVVLARDVVAALALVALAVALGGWATVWREVQRPLGVVALGTMSFGVNAMLAMAAQAYLPASVNGLLNNLHPLWLAVGTAALGRAPRPAVLLAGSLLAVLGMALVLHPAGAPGAIAPLGVALSVLGSLSIAGSSVLGRRIMPGRTAIATTGFAAAVGALVVAPLAWLEQTPVVPAAWSVTHWALLLYLGLGSTAMNFALWFFALKHLPATQAAIYQYLIPPIGVALSVLLGGESLTWGLLLGSAAVVVGIALGVQGTRARGPAAGYCAPTRAGAAGSSPSS